MVTTPWGFLCDSNHRCKVVRILKCDKEPALFKVEIFSSETCEWTEAVVPFPQGITYDDIRSSVDHAGIACNATLYWLGSSGLVIALDPSECDNRCSFISKPDVAAGSSSSSSSCEQCLTVCRLNPKFHCSFISKPATLSASSSCEQCITVSRGRLRLCQFYNEPPCPIFYVWNLKENDHQVDGVGGKKVQWCLKEKIVLSRLLAMFYWKPLALDPIEKMSAN